MSHVIINILHEESVIKMYHLKHFYILICIVIIGFLLSSCRLSIDSYAFNIEPIQMLEVISFDENDRSSDSIIATFDQLSADDQMVIDLNTLFTTYTYHIWEDYRLQKNRATLESLNSVIVVVHTETESYIFGLASMSYPHLDHVDYEEKTVLLDSDLLPLRVMDNTLYTDLLNLSGIS